MNTNFLPARIIPTILLSFICAAFLSAALMYTACTGYKVTGEGSVIPDSGHGADPVYSAVPVAADDLASGINLGQIAEIERAGAYFPGLALAESGFRERNGDYAGAAVAAYKELSWAYGCGATARKQVEEGLQNALVLFEESSPVSDPRRNSGTAAIMGCIAFTREDWEEAEKFLTGILTPDEEPDSFLQWMLFVCTLEREDRAPVDKVRAARSAYGAIRARYTLFPEYWYRGARAFSAEPVTEVKGGSIAASYAEQCVNTSPQGPFADDCRKILANHLGIPSNEKDTRDDLRPDIRTKAEIENIIRASVAMNKPEILEELFPLIALPDNPYTLYALGAMKTLSSVPEFRAFFIEGTLKSPGRLGERLNYISRG